VVPVRVEVAEIQTQRQPLVEVEAALECACLTFQLTLFREQRLLLQLDLPAWVPLLG